MKKLSLIGCLAIFLFGLSLSSVYAAPFVIKDNYIGGAPTHQNWVGEDVIGEDHLYDIDSMEVTLAGGNLNVNVVGNYFDNVGSDKTYMGDLFISADGWTPHGEAPYTMDWALNGEDWEYALVMDSRDNSQSEGILSLHSVDPAGIDNSNLNGYDPRYWVYRDGQEVSYNPGTANSLAIGTWKIDGNTLNYNISYNNWGFTGDEIGFHWTMSCGNDVIEGAVPTPEPATILLFGLGLLGMTAFIRKKKVR